jgi:hypothetical protein
VCRVFKEVRDFRDFRAQLVSKEVREFRDRLVL